MITKRIIKGLLLFTGLPTVCTSYAQEYNFIHYDVKEGLAGSTVKSTISITNEIKYLKRYLELETMRFGHSFNYIIEVDPALDPDLEHIPTMILLNRQLGDPISIEINDLTDAHDQATGTRITLHVPDTITFKPVKK